MPSRENSALEESRSLKGDVWFAYDGDCPVCTYAAHALRIRKDVDDLHLVDAREGEDHPLLREITAQGLDLDEGMVLKFGGRYYHGPDALHMMALLGSPSGWFNRLNATLYRSRILARLLYPPMRGTRNLLLRLKGIDPLHNLVPRDEPVFARVFGKDWDALPKVMKDHYAVRPYSDDRVVAKGTLDVKVSSLVRLSSRLTGLLVSRSGENVPVRVVFRSGPASGDFMLDRTFSFPEGEQKFISTMKHVGGNEVIEFMALGLGWKCAYGWDGEKITLAHRGYVWRVLGYNLPLPLGLVLGKGAAEEHPHGEDEFSMWTHMRHPLFGDGLAYSGTFRITEVSCPDAS